MKPRYVIIAGVNGAGKSTIYQKKKREFLKDMKRVNADEILRTFSDDWQNPANIVRSGKEAIKLLRECLANKITFNQETTLTGHSLFSNINKAKNAGYNVELFYVGLDSAEIAKARIAYRVTKGGHGVSDQDVERRYIASLENLKKLIPICDVVIVFDNSAEKERVVACYKRGQIIQQSKNIPKWFEKFPNEMNHQPENKSRLLSIELTE